MPKHFFILVCFLYAGFITFVVIIISHTETQQDRASFPTNQSTTRNMAVTNTPLPFSVSNFPASSAQVPIRWNYRFRTGEFNGTRTEFQNLLNQEGQGKWELVSIVSNINVDEMKNESDPEREISITSTSP